MTTMFNLEQLKSQANSYLDVFTDKASYLYEKGKAYVLLSHLTESTKYLTKEGVELSSNIGRKCAAVTWQQEQCKRISTIAAVILGVMLYNYDLCNPNLIAAIGNVSTAWCFKKVTDELLRKYHFQVQTRSLCANSKPVVTHVKTN